MTVIAWDGKTLAADKRSSDDSSHRTVTKIRRTADGSLIGTCGPASACREMEEWFEAGANPDTLPLGQRVCETAAWLLAITPAREIRYWQLGAHPMLVEDEKIAIGSGLTYALAAMHLGCNARVAVQVAIDLCPSCGNGIDALEFE